jgi:hypothetical protein
LDALFYPISNPSNDSIKKKIKKWHRSFNFIDQIIIYIYIYIYIKQTRYWARYWVRKKEHCMLKDIIEKHKPAIPYGKYDVIMEK